MSPPFFNVSEIVDTRYGEMTVTELRLVNGIHHIIGTPTTWQLADYSTSQPKFFMNPEDCNRKLPACKVGDYVTCPYGGAGIVKEVRDVHYVVHLLNWIMADGKSPVCHLQHDVVKLDVKRQKAEAETAKQLVDWRALLTTAVKSKEEAAICFKNKNFDGAKTCYLSALASLNSMGTTLPDTVRAEVLEHTIPCHNNIALCCMKSGKYDESRAFANNVVMLVEALEQQILSGAGHAQGSQGKDTNNGSGSGERTLSMVWVEFKKRGMTFTKLIKDWKKKSLFYMGKAAYLAHDYDQAIEFLSMAIAILVTPLEGSVANALAVCDGNSMEVQALVNDSVYLTTETSANGDVVMKGPVNGTVDNAKNDAAYQQNLKELTDLLQQSKNAKQKQEKKEKATWSKAFAKSAEESALVEESSSSPKKSPSPRSVAASASPTNNTSSQKQKPVAASKEKEDSEDEYEYVDEEEEEGILDKVMGSSYTLPLVAGITALGLFAWLRPKK